MALNNQARNNEPAQALLDAVVRCFQGEDIESYEFDKCNYLERHKRMQPTLTENTTTTRKAAVTLMVILSIFLLTLMWTLHQKHHIWYYETFTIGAIFVVLDMVMLSVTTALAVAYVEPLNQTQLNETHAGVTASIKSDIAEHLPNDFAKEEEDVWLDCPDGTERKRDQVAERSDFHNHWNYRHCWQGQQSKHESEAHFHHPDVGKSVFASCAEAPESWDSYCGTFGRANVRRPVSRSVVSKEAVIQ